jgi:hypothetical protein
VPKGQPARTAPSRETPARQQPQKPRPSAPEEPFDPLLGEKFDENELALRPPESIPPAPDEQDQRIQQEIDKIEAQGNGMRQRLATKLNTVFSRMKLEEALAQQLLEISLEGLGRVLEVRKEFAGREMTDSERDYLKSRIQAVNADTTLSIRTLLGEDLFKKFQRESRYYDNPNARVADEVKELKKQTRELQKKVEEKPPSTQPGTSRPRPSRLRPRGR